MSPPRDPPRLLDPGADTPDWIRSPMEAGLRDVPDRGRLARIAAGLPSGPAGPGPTAPQTPAAPLPSALSGAAVGAALGLAVVGAGWIASSLAPSPPPAVRSALIASVSLAAPAAPAPPTEARAPSARPRAPSERPLPAALASSPVTSGPATTPTAPEPSSVAGNPGSEPAAVAAEPDVPAADRESAILQRAQDALSGSPARALAITDEHLARYPGGQLAQEREVIAVAALLGMGRAADARARAERFFAAYPTSGQRRRLAVLIPDLESRAGAHKESAERPSTP